MKEVLITLLDIVQIKKFYSVINQFPETNFYLISGSHKIDGKSIMGIFSLNLSIPILLRIEGNDDMDRIIEMLHPFIVNNSK